MLRMLGELLASPVTSRFSASTGSSAASAHRLPHVHWFVRSGDDPFSSASLYTCRCGVVRPGM